MELLEKREGIRIIIDYFSATFPFICYALTMKNSIDAFTETKCKMEKFATVIQKYTDIKELNATILNELIDKIVIHQREYIDGKRKQQIDIYYNFVGII